MALRESPEPLWNAREFRFASGRGAFLWGSNTRACGYLRITCYMGLTRDSDLVCHCVGRCRVSLVKSSFCETGDAIRSRLRDGRKRAAALLGRLWTIRRSVQLSGLRVTLLGEELTTGNNLAGFPTATRPVGTSDRTTAPAPIVAQSPMCTSPRMQALAPM